MKGWAWLALFALVACPPSLDGAPCNSDNDCPSSQHCVAPKADAGALFGQCQDGARGKTDYMLDAGVDAGIDAGPQCASAPLSGTITLNGGGPLPSENLVWVDVWDHEPALLGPDGGRPYEPPTFQVQAGQGTGSFSVPNLTPGKVYWVSGQFDITNSDDGGDLVDAALSFPTPYAAGFQPACNLPLDVSTLQRCEVVTVYNHLLGTYMLEAIADVRNLANPSQELTSDTAVTIQVPDAGASGFVSLGLQGDPTVFDAGIDGGVIFGGFDYAAAPLVYAAAGSLPLSGTLAGDIPASAGPYAFSISGSGYRQGTCLVQVAPQMVEPSLQTTTLTWTDGGMTVTWESATDFVPVPGAQVSTYDFIIVGYTYNNVLTAAWISEFLPQNSNYHSYNLPLGACPPDGGSCSLVLFSSRDVKSSLGANPMLESLEESGVYVPAIPHSPPGD